MYAPRAKFERIYIVSPVKVAIIFLMVLHCLFLLIALLTSFWIQTKFGHYGPLYSCENRLHWKTTSRLSSITTECQFVRSFHRLNLLWMPITALFIILSFIITLISILIATLSFIKKSFTIRRRYWLFTILLLLIVFLLDSFVIIFIPLSHHQQIYYLQWAYGIHCGATLFISVSLITAILTHNTDDIQYIEAIEESSIDK
ncbi:unnamed protein product [Adineta steineri]|uniref:Uncharacterized protein n=1 Tax=Adineta steineri TaxID=433720 RepID=A0A818N6Y8_9BILA|nr:unnamed protein product [Adineta steineri]CAF3600759.1 unnamed protein product [Adineta steineri]CAF3911809.1 unnamed protein product [Adineta steineri]